MSIPRQHCITFRGDHARVGRDCDLALAAYGFDAISADYNHRVLQRRPAKTVNEPSAHERQHTIWARLLGRGGAGRQPGSSQHQEKNSQPRESLPHKTLLGTGWGKRGRFYRSEERRVGKGGRGWE